MNDLEYNLIYPELIEVPLIDRISLDEAGDAEASV